MKTSLLNSFVRTLAIALVGISLAFTACKKDKVDVDRLANSAEDNARIEGEFQNINDLAEDAGENSSGKTSEERWLPDCATVTRDTLSTPKTITIDFGTTNCLCRDGLYRRGKILISYSGDFRHVGHSRTMTLDDYYVNDGQITGTKTVTFATLDTVNGNAEATYNIVIDSASYTSSDGSITRSWSSNRTRIRYKGHETRTILDDAYKIYGNATGQNRHNEQFIAVVESASPLVKDFAECGLLSNGRGRFISGKVTINIPSATKTISIDYGDGACDRLATVNVNGEIRTITLR